MSLLSLQSLGFRRLPKAARMDEIGYRLNKHIESVIRVTLQRDVPAAETGGGEQARSIGCRGR